MNGRRRRPNLSGRADRPLAKAITTRNLLDDLIYDIALREARPKRRRVTQKAIAEWNETLRDDWAEMILKHLDAHDQGG